jgi:hypothetical protein
MQTSPGDSENLQGDLLPHKIKSKCCTQNGFGGTSTPPPHLQAVQEPIFLWLLHILAMGVVAVSGIFWQARRYSEHPHLANRVIS